MRKTSRAATAPIPETPPAPALEPVKPIELRYGYQTSEASPMYSSTHVTWARLVEEASKGKIKVTHFPSQSLFKAVDSYDAIKGGIGDITWVPGGYLSGRFPLAEVSTLPFLFGEITGEEASQAFWKLYEKTPALQEEFADIKLLAIHAAASSYPASTKKPIRNIDDIKGMKIRTTKGIKMEMWPPLGAAPVFISGSDIYDAAEKGVVDDAKIDVGLLST